MREPGFYWLHPKDDHAHEPKVGRFHPYIRPGDTDSDIEAGSSWYVTGDDEPFSQNELEQDYDIGERIGPLNPPKVIPPPPKDAVTDRCHCRTHVHVGRCKSKPEPGKRLCEFCRRGDSEIRTAASVKKVFLCLSCSDDKQGVNGGPIRCAECGAFVCAHLIDRDVTKNPMQIWCAMCPPEVVKKVRTRRER